MKKYFWYGTPLLLLAIAALLVIYYQDIHKKELIQKGLIPKETSPHHQYFSFDQWKVFREEGPLGFQALFPTLPLHASEQVIDPNSQEIRNYSMYVSEKEKGGTVFMVTIVSYPEGSKTLEKEAVMDNLMKQMVSKTTPSNKILSANKEDFLGNKALEFSFKGENLTWDTKTFINGKSLYVLTAIFKNEAYNRSEFDYFIHSFEFIEKN